MQRITEPTRATDPFGTGEPGFTDGNSGLLIPGTELNSDWFNNGQEEIARCVESDGQTVIGDGGTQNYFQLSDAVQGLVRSVCTNATVEYVLEGFQFNIAGTSLTVSIVGGEFVENGRRFVITDALLTAEGFNSWILTASRDHYFYLASEDPGALATPPNRATVHMERTVVLNNAGAPATPAGTFLFAMVRTDGTDATDVFYYNRGPRLVHESGSAVVLRPNLGTDSSTAFYPSSSGMSLGIDAVDSITNRFGVAYLRELDLRGSFPTTFTYARNHKYTFYNLLPAGAIEDSEALLNADDYPDGTTALVEIKVVATDPTDPTDGFTALVSCHVHKDGSNWDMDGTGGAGQLVIIGSTQGAAAGMTCRLHLDGVDPTLHLEMTGHATDDTRWFIVVEITINGD